MPRGNFDHFKSVHITGKQSRHLLKSWIQIRILITLVTRQQAREQAVENGSSEEADQSDELSTQETNDSDQGIHWLG